MESSGETAIWGSSVDGKLEIAGRAEPATDLHMTAPLGRRLPLEKGAHGKVLTTREEVGYDDQELFPGVRASAAPIVDAQRRRNRGRDGRRLQGAGRSSHAAAIGERCAARRTRSPPRIGRGAA